MIFCHERFKGQVDLYSSYPQIFKNIGSHKRYGHIYYDLVDTNLSRKFYLSDWQMYVKHDSIFLGMFEKDYRNYWIHSNENLFSNFNTPLLNLYTENELPINELNSPEFELPVNELNSPEFELPVNELNLPEFELPVTQPVVTENNISNLLKCPITHQIMQNPVIMMDGYTYEKSAIERWLQDHDRSPMTNIRLRDTRLIPNLKLQEIILEISQ